MCGVSAGVCRCVRVCADVCGCAQVCVGMRGRAWVCTSIRGMHRCVWVCAGVHGYAQVYVACTGVCGCTQVCTGVCGSVRECVGVYECVLDEFSEYLLETRVNTSADFNTYPIRIFCYFLLLHYVIHIVEKIQIWTFKKNLLFSFQNIFLAKD